MQTRVLSGVQPTGNLHLGNYLGAIKNWTLLQDEHECLFCIVDLHAITVFQEPEKLKAATYDTIAAYIACGIDPKKSAIFNQASVKAHCELAWILGTITPLGWLNRMTQFKEKSGKYKENSGLGLYSYPVLMAADILLYHATHVPVGDDQKQHLELTRDIAALFNRTYNKEYFKLPEPLIQKEASRIMSLRDGTKKMSKSDESDYSRINLSDTADDIIRKIRKAKSDIFEGISYDEEKRPEASNLLNIYIAITGQERKKTYAEFENYGFSKFKDTLAEALVEHLSPINNEFRKLQKDRQYLHDLLAKGKEKANFIAETHIKEIKDIVGFVNV